MVDPRTKSGDASETPDLCGTVRLVPNFSTVRLNDGGGGDCSANARDGRVFSIELETYYTSIKVPNIAACERQGQRLDRHTYIGEDLLKFPHTTGTTVRHQH